MAVSHDETVRTTFEVVDERTQTKKKGKKTKGTYHTLRRHSLGRRVAPADTLGHAAARVTVRMTMMWIAVTSTVRATVAME